MNNTLQSLHCCFWRFSWGQGIPAFLLAFDSDGKREGCPRTWVGAFERCFNFAVVLLFWGGVVRGGGHLSRLVVLLFHLMCACCVFPCHV
jgi:hypothetical protein